MKLNRARKRQLRCSVRNIVVNVVQELDSKHFDEVSENPEEAAYVEKFREDLVKTLTVNNGTDGTGDEASGD